MDLPGIIEGAAHGRGRGRQVIAVAKSSDLILMVLDAAKGEEQKKKLSRELEMVGLRLNQDPPDVNFVVTKTGGLRFNSTVRLTHVNFFFWNILANQTNSLIKLWLEISCTSIRSITLMSF